MRNKLNAIFNDWDEQNKAHTYYNNIMLVIIMFSIFPLCFKETNRYFIYIERVTTTIFIIDYVLRWITADLNYKKSRIAAFILYPFTPFAIIDLLSILPSILMINSGLRLLKLFRLNKVVKTLKVLRHSKSFNLILNVIMAEKKALLAVCYLAAGYTLLSALIMFQVEPESFENFFDAIYWATVTLTTVGYGDIYPISDIGRVVSMISSFMGIAIVALPTGIITAGYMNEINKNN